MFNSDGKFSQQVERSKYLGSVITQNEKLDEEVKGRLGVAGKLFNRNIKGGSVGIQKDDYSDNDSGSETWTTSKKQSSKIYNTEMRYLREIDEKTIINRVRNDDVRHILKMQPAENIIE
ncbi:hypothetical protein ILUMI_07005 [Ignelater luminosus]|uniref:Uncharacterized protein n=1 Tax=Ignelater luminosus TaxID=2038154 RepID=A0A8K0DED4_IGNLU|nr:hypothetical protein ILUMI_07005 [Ignelater luminosus]